VEDIINENSEGSEDTSILMSIIVENTKNNQNVNKKKIKKIESINSLCEYNRKGV
jgi:hypothetical protein